MNRGLHTHEPHRRPNTGHEEVKYCQILEKFKETETSSLIVHCHLFCATQCVLTCPPDITGPGTTSTIIESQGTTATPRPLVSKTLTSLLGPTTERHGPTARSGKGPGDQATGRPLSHVNRWFWLHVLLRLPEPSRRTHRRGTTCRGCKLCKAQSCIRYTRASSCPPPVLHKNVPNTYQRMNE